MNKWIFAISFILFMVLVNQRVGNGLMKDDILIIISTLSFVTFFTITRRINWYPILSRQIILFGQYSLSIYVMQFYLTHITIGMPITLFNSYNPILLFILCSLISIPLAYFRIGFAKLTEINKTLDLILLGKIKYQKNQISMKN